MDDFDKRKEWEREEEQARRDLYGDGEARAIVDGLLARWDEFTTLPREPQYMNAIYDEVLGIVASRLDDGTSREQIPILAAAAFRDALNRLERQR